MPGARLYGADSLKSCASCMRVLTSALNSAARFFMLSVSSELEVEVKSDLGWNHS